jgi:hypothetical protein
MEPHTGIYRTALQEGLLEDRTNLLAEDEKELMGLFYNPPSQRYMTVTLDVLLTVIEKLLKPSAKFVFRFASRLRGRKSRYDS